MGARLIVTDDAGLHATEREQLRIRDLLELMPAGGESVLDVGARDGYLSKLFAERFVRVVALDLEKPKVDHPRVDTVVGDVTALTYEDNAFDSVVCAEVLEHIPEAQLERACSEIIRVARHSVIVGVPYKQDLRYAESRCQSCGNVNPPWGHINSFDEQRLNCLFGCLTLARLSYVGRTRERTNAVSAGLMRFAGNPYGTYVQDEPCVHCGARLQPPARRTLVQRLATRAAYTIDRVQQAFVTERAHWIHARFQKGNGFTAGGGP
jgi:SAM-dependent methyltransferase